MTPVMRFSLTNPKSDYYRALSFNMPSRLNSSSKKGHEDKYKIHNNNLIILKHNTFLFFMRNIQEFKSTS